MHGLTEAIINRKLLKTATELNDKMTNFIVFIQKLYSEKNCNDGV